MSETKKTYSRLMKKLYLLINDFVDNQFDLQLPTKKQRSDGERVYLMRYLTARDEGLSHRAGLSAAEDCMLFYLFKLNFRYRSNGKPVFQSYPDSVQEEQKLAAASKTKKRRGKAKHGEKVASAHP